MRTIAAFVLTALLFSPATLFAGKVELTTYYPAPNGEYRQLRATGSDTLNTTVALQASGSTTATPGLAVTNANQVGIGTAAPATTLDVRGQIRSVQPGVAGTIFSTAATAIDWNNGNVIITSANPQAMTFSNMQEGGAYTLIVTGATSGMCTFSQGALTFKYSPLNGVTTAGRDTIYTFIRAGNTVYVSWIVGF